MFSIFYNQKPHIGTSRRTVPQIVVKQRVKVVLDKEWQEKLL